MDPFGSNDPAWERYEGVSQYRAWARNRRRGQRARSRRIWREMPSALVAGLLIFGIMVGAVFLVVWIGAVLLRMFS